MISPDPKMSNQLFNDCLEYGLDPASGHNVDELMTRYWDEVSDAVLATADKHNVTPQYVIEEWCLDSDFPDEIDENEENN